MKTNWKVNLYTFNEELIDTLLYYDMTKGEVERLAKNVAKVRKAHTFSLEEQNTRWIKSKIAVVFGINKQYAGMCTVNNQQELNKVKEKYDFPYMVDVIEDIPTFEEFMSQEEKD